VRFVDTNILLYAVSSAKADRQATRTGATAALSHESAVAFIATLLRFPVEELTVPLLRAALAARARWRLSYFDAAMWKRRESRAATRSARKTCNTATTSTACAWSIHLSNAALRVTARRSA